MRGKLYLSDEEMVKVRLKRLLVHIKDLVAKMQRVGTITPLDNTGIRLFNRVA